MKSRSALVVSLHLDGFRRASGRGLVASHCRPWGSLRFRLHSPSLHADCSVRRPGEPGPSSQCAFPSESVLAGSRYRVPAALCPLAVAPPCSLAGSAQVRRTPCQGTSPLARTSSPRGPRVHLGPPLAQLSTRASHRKRHSCRKRQASDHIASRMGMLRPVSRTSTATTALHLRLRAVRRARSSFQVLLPPKRLGSAALRQQRRPKSTPSETPNFAAACATVPSGQRRVLDFACSVNRCQSTFSARPPRFARPRGLAPPTSPESPPRLAARPGFAPPLGFYSPSKVILAPTRSGSRRGAASRSTAASTACAV